jgi:hypothetical protein
MYIENGWSLQIIFSYNITSGMIIIDDIICEIVLEISSPKDE